MKPARDNISRAYGSMRRRYCGLACGKNVWLQLQVFMSIVTTTTLYGGELWGVHPRTAAQRHITTQKYSKHLRQLLRISPSTNMAVVLVRDRCLVFTATMVAGFHQILESMLVVLPMGDLYRDLMFDSLQEAVTHGPLNKGFVKGLTEQCAQIGFSLADLGLLPVNLKMIMNLSQLQQRAGMDGRGHLPAHLSVSGRHGLHLTAAGFLREPGQGGRPFFQLPANERKITQLMRFRLGCHGLPSDVGRHRTDSLPRHERLCTRLSGREGGREAHGFRMFCTSAYPRRVSRSFCWAPHDAILYESGRSEEYYSLCLCMPGLQQRHGGRCIAILRWASGPGLSWYTN